MQFKFNIHLLFRLTIKKLRLITQQINIFVFLREVLLYTYWCQKQRIVLLSRSSSFSIFRHSKRKWIFQEDLKRGKAATNDLLSNRINDKLNYLDGSVSLFRKVHQKYTYVIHTFQRILSSMTNHIIWWWEIFIYFLFIFTNYFRISHCLKISKYQLIQSINYAHISLFVKHSGYNCIVIKIDKDILKSIHHLVRLLVNVRNAMSFWNFFDILTQA